MTTHPPSAFAPAWDSTGLARALFEQSPFSSVIYDPTGRPIALNAAFRAMWGVGIETVPPSYTVLADPELERRGALPLVRRAFEGEVVVTPPVRYDIARVSATGEGRAIWTEGYFFPVRDATGVLTHVVLTHIDLTAQKDAEEALRESEARMRLAQHAAHIGVFDWHVPSGRVTWTEEEERIFGLEPGTFVGTIEGWGERVLPEDRARMQRDMADHMARREREMSFAFRIRRPDGEIRSIEGRAAFVYAPDGSPLRMVGVNLDVTERARLDAALRESEAQLRETQRIARVGSWAWDVATNALSWSDVLCELYGLPAGSPPADYEGFIHLVHPDDRAMTHSVIERALQRGDSFAFDHRVVWPDGGVHKLHGRGRVIRDDQGRPVRMVGSSVDITEQWLATAAAQASEERLRVMFDEAPVGIAQVALDSRTLAVNRKLAEMLGYSRDELETLRWENVTHPDDTASDQELIGALMSGRSASHTVEKRYLRKDGGVVWARLTATIVRDDAGAPQYVISVVEDITARVQAEHALRETEQRTHALVESVTDPLIAYDREWRILYLNEPARDVFRTYGVSGDPLHRPLWDLVPTMRGTEIERNMRHAMAAGEPTSSEVPLRTGGWIEIRTYPTADGLVAYWADVTERRRSRERAELLAAASAALAEAVGVEAALSALLRFVSQHLADYCLVHLVDERGTPTHADVMHRDPARTAMARELEAGYRLPPDATVGAPAVIRSGRPSLQKEISPERLRLAARDAEHLALLEGLGMVSTIVVPLTARGRTLGALTLVSAESGRRYDEQDLALVEELARRAALAIENARLYALADRARREAEEARARAEEANHAKTEFLTTMSHELRTPLNAIAGYAGLLEMGVRGPMTHEQREDLHRIQRSQKHLLGLINEVLNYARLESGMVTYDIRPTLVADSVSAAAALVEPQRTAKGLTLDVRLPEFAGRPPCYVLADTEKLQQVLLNLLSNAVKFTPEGGRVTVELLHAPDARGVAELRVSDTGIGIPADKLEAIFEPFVQVGRSLSNPGEGTGLGLAISRDLARGMGGDLAVESTLGQGSTFTLTLPLA